jgi:hypothetical protein
MTTVTTQQLAELLVGIARAQYAVVEAMEAARPGFRATHAAPAITTAARIRDPNRQTTLADLPSRVLLQCQSRTGPDVAGVLRDLEQLISRSASAAPAAASATPAAGAGDSLDMTKPA